MNNETTTPKHHREDKRTAELVGERMRAVMDARGLSLDRAAAVLGLAWNDLRPSCRVQTRPPQATRTPS